MKSEPSMTGRAFMNYSACWRSKKALVSTSDVTPLIPQQIGLQLSVLKSQGYLILCKCWTVTFQPLSIDTCDIYMLTNNCLLPVIVIRLLFGSLFDFHSVLCFIVNPVKIFSSDSGMYYRYFDPHNNIHQAIQ